MPFSLFNAPATFQRLIQQCLGDQLIESTPVYLNDVIVFSKDFSAHLNQLEKAFQEVLGPYGLKPHPKKCKLF